MIGFMLFFGFTVTLVCKTIINDRREYIAWYKKCEHILKK